MMSAWGVGGWGRPPPGSCLVSVPRELARNLTYQTFKNGQIGSDPTTLPGPTA